MRRLVIADTQTIDMADDRGTLGAACPVLAGLVLARRKGAAIRHRAGQRVMLVGRIAAAVDDVALLGQRGLLCQIVLTVQLVDILSDDDALGVLPRTLADPVARIDGGFAVGRLGAEIGVPGPAARAGRLRQLLAMPVGAVEAAEIGALTDAGARGEEGDGGLVRVCRAAGGGRRQRGGR